MPEFLSPVAWIVHPLAGITLAFLASVIFSARRSVWTPLLGAVGLLALLSLTGAHWAVHPAAGLTLALIASLAFQAWKREWPTLLAALLALALFAALGAGWAVYPLAGLTLAWLAKVVFSGELWRETRRPALGAQPSVSGALPAEAQGEVIAVALPGLAERALQRVTRLELGALQQGQTPGAPPSPPRRPDQSGLLALAGDERLPAEARERLRTLHARCQEALSYLAERGSEATGMGSDPAAFLLSQIESDYAPEAARAYLKLPPSHAGVTPLQDGKTGRDLLREQLDLLLGAVQDIMADAAQAGSQHLLAHQRFLKERFAPPPDDLKL
ncbi:hypothetical protein [Deinococcus sp.]|uniref:hypothetical protein n=1 Tax=Deinococcus sp. TaxID=47478 RepID=UPI003CC66D94